MHPITIGTISTLCMFHSSLISIPRSVYFSIFWSFFSMILWSFGMVTSINITVRSRLSTNIMSGRLALISLSVCILKSHSILKFSFSSTGEGSYLYHSQFFFTRSLFRQICRCKYFATLLCLLRYNVFAYFGQPLIIWCMVSAFSLHFLHLSFSVVLYMFFSMYRVFTAWSWIACTIASVCPFSRESFIQVSDVFRSICSSCSNLWCCPCIGIFVRVAFPLDVIEFFTRVLHSTLFSSTMSTNSNPISFAYVSALRITELSPLLLSHSRNTLGNNNSDFVK